MSSKLLNTLIDELRQDYKVVLLDTFNDLQEEQQGMLGFYYDEDVSRNPGNLLSSLERSGKISWTDVGSLKNALRAIKMEKLACTLEEYEIKRDLALLFDTYARKRQGLVQTQVPSSIEDVAGYLAKIADGVLHKTVVESLRKSRKNLQDLMKDVETGIAYKLSNALSKLALLIVILGEVTAETERTKEECGPKPEVLKSFSAEICSRMKGQITMVRIIISGIVLHDWRAFLSFMCNKYSLHFEACLYRWIFSQTGYVL